MTGSGHLSLDGKLQPQGALRLQTRGHEAIVDSLETAGILSARKAIATMTALDLLRTSSGNGVNGHVPITLQIQGGRLYLGPVKLIKIPTLW